MRSLKRTLGYGTSACWAAALLGSVFGCGQADPEMGKQVTLLAPAVTGSELVLVEPERSRSLWLGVGAGSPEAKVTERSVPEAPVLLEKRKGSDELLLLCQRPESENADSGGQLVVLGPDGIERSYELGARYNRITQSEDGRFAFLSTRQTESAGTLYFNPDDVSIVDLDADPGKNNPSQRTLSSGGETLSGTFVSPELEIAGKKRRLGVILFESRLSILDLSHPGRAEWTAKLAGPDATGGGVGLEQALFAGQSIYVRGRQARDVYVLGLGSKTPEGADGNDFGFSLNQPGAGQPTSDIELFEGQLLLATTYTTALLAMDLGSSKLTTIELGTRATSIVPFVTVEQDGTERSQALLFEPGQRVVSFLELSGLTERKERNLETVVLPDGIETVTELEDHRLLVTHSGTGLSVIDLLTRGVTLIKSPVHLSQGSVLVDAEHDRVWLAATEQSRVGFFDLEGLQPREVVLDAPLQFAGLVEGTEGHKLVLTHASAFGYLTIVDAEEPKRQTAVSLRGYLVDGILDRGDD